MEEIKKERKEVQESKKKVKSFKMDEAQLERVNQLLTKIDGSTDSEKLLDVLELAIKRNEVAELPKTLNDSYTGDREKIATAIMMINSTFETLMINTSEVIKSREAELVKSYQAEIEKFQNREAELTGQLQSAREVSIEFEDERLKAVESEAKMRKEVEVARTEIEFRDKTITALTTQIEEMKVQIAKKDSEIAELVADSRKYKDKIETLEVKNEELMFESTESQQVNQRLTSQLSISEVNLKNEQAKNEDLKAQIKDIQSELASERQSKSDLQVNLIQLMSQMSQVSQSSGKDIVQKEKHTPQSKTQKKVKKPFTVLDPSGKELWSGNKNGLVKYVNNIQTKKEITTLTNMSEVEELLHPCILVQAD